MRIFQGGCVLGGVGGDVRAAFLGDPSESGSGHGSIRTDGIAVLCGCVLRSVQACAVGELMQLSRRQFVQQSYSVNGVLDAPVCR